MYRVLDICRYIINYCNDKDYNLSNLKLQKMLYFIQAFYLCKTDEKEPCFQEKIEAWDFGPVVPVAYHEYKQFGSANIPKVLFYIEYNDGNFWESKVVPYNDQVIADKDKTQIMALVDNLAKYSTTTLVSITHQQTPWKAAYACGKNTEIDLESIRSYFNA